MSKETTTPYDSIYSKCSLNAEPSRSSYGSIDGSISSNDSTSAKTEDEVIVLREKPAYAARKDQLSINMLCLEGGRPYVNARLSRFAGETQIDWIGGQRPDGSCSTGRLQQTHAFPHLGRIAGKVNQYVFQVPPKREGADEDVIKDITRDGKSVNDLMRTVSDYVFAGKWCWIGVDAPARKENGEQYTQAEKEAKKIRPYWQVYNALDVLDWKFDETGELLWLKSQRIEYDDVLPTSQPKPYRVISLWLRGTVIEYKVIEKKDRRYSGNKKITVEKTEIELTNDKGQPMTSVPFVLVGDPSAKPIAFDDLESINRTIMDLGSVDRANIFNSVYAQLTLPASLMTRMQSDSYTSNADEIGKLVIGMKYPILLEKEDPTPQYIMPDASSLKVIPERLTELKRDLFQVVGLALEQESRQVASAEAKAWDFLDVSAVMKSRAEMLQDAETKAVALSQEWDSGYQVWEPVYNTDFDIGNFKDEIAAIVSAGNMNLPESVIKMLVKKLVDRTDRIGSRLTTEQIDEIYADIENWNPNDFATDLALP